MLTYRALLASGTGLRWEDLLINDLPAVKEAIELSDNAYLSDFHKRLRLFKAGKAYREGVPPFEEAVETTVAEEEVTDSDSAVETSEELESTSTNETNIE